MYMQCTLGAIFILFIWCVHCDSGVNNNEKKNIYVPSAPQNLSANSVSSKEIQISWVPPTTFILRASSLPQSDEPVHPDTSTEQKLQVIPKRDTHTDLSPEHRNIMADSPNRDEMDTNSFKEKNWYKEEDNISESTDDYITDQSDNHRSSREARTRRHRKRRQETIPANSTETHQSFELPRPPVEVVKKSHPPHKDPTQVAYVLYYEQGVPRLDSSPVSGVPKSEDIKSKNVFPSDLGMQDTKATKNLTLLNTAGVLAKVVGFRLRNLTSFTAYKIWVRAFYNFSLDGVKSSDLVDRLGPPSAALYVLTDVRSPSAPIVLNLTCEQENDNLYLQWRQPISYDNTLDQYVVTLRKVPEENPRRRLTLPTSKNDFETTISMNLEFSNMTRYEVKIYAVTLSVVKKHTLINGTESPPQEVSSDSCIAHVEAHSPEQRQSESHVTSVALLAALLIAVLAAVAVIAVYWRCRSRLSKCISAAYSYLEDGGERTAGAPLHSYKKPVCVSTAVPPVVTGPPRPPRLCSALSPPLPAAQFPAHVAALHADGDIGFSKEYEIVVTKSAALGHTSHHSHLPENRLKNRYLNITAYDHSRVCVSAGGACSMTHSGCDYVNANFIDGMLPALDDIAVNRIKKKLERRNNKDRQPPPKPAKPQPVLSEGIESAFLNIEFSGIVDSDEAEDDVDSDQSEDDELDDVYVDIDGVPTQVKLEWLIWRRRYIATQGPTPATLDSFWKMNWQHRVHTIVMITNLVERGRRKCDMYWPGGSRGSSMEYGGVTVTLLEEDVRAAYTVRTLRLRNRHDSSGGDRTVRHYHYTVWPDHGTPRHPQLVLPFVRAAASDSGTVLVHCSAGVGRTGTYIVLDAQLNQLQLTGTLSPLGFLCRARTQRNHLVQTEEQYVFVHDALLEHVRSGVTEIEFNNIRDYLVKLLQPIAEDELAVLDLNTSKAKSVNDLTNGYEQAETQSVKSSQANDSLSVKGSQNSLKTDDLSEKFSDKSKTPVKEAGDCELYGKIEANGDVMGELVNGDETEGVYDLAPKTDTYSKKMQAYNNLSDAEKEEIRKANRVENYAILERMRSLSSRNQQYQGPPPVNILEKQVLLISRSWSSAAVCARAAHNADKNPPGAALPTDEARVLLVPKPGVEGSEYINASWVSGRRRMREYCVCAHPASNPGPLWRLLWDHTAQILLDLSPPECEVFWPTEEEKELYVANFKASFVSTDIYVAHRKCDVKQETTETIEQNGLRRQESSECADDERLIPEHSPVNQSEPSYRFDQTELRLERLSTGSRDLSTRKSIANGDLFSSEKKNGPKSPKSPSKMSLKNFKLSSPTKFKFPDWSRAGSPPETAPPPPPVAPSLSIEEEIELRRPCYTFEKVDSVPENIPLDRIIYVTNVSVHSLQDDYQLNVKFIKCQGWLDGDTTSYTAGKPDDNVFIKAVREASSDVEIDTALQALSEPFKDSFALIEFVAGCQMEYKNGPVVVIDKHGASPSLPFCSLSAACGGVRGAGGELSADVYCWNSVSAGTRTAQPAHDPLLRQYAAVYHYSMLHSDIYARDNQTSESSASSSKSSTHESIDDRVQKHEDQKKERVFTH